MLAMFLQTSDGLQLYVHLAFQCDRFSAFWLRLSVVAFQCDDVTTLLRIFYPKILEVS